MTRTVLALGLALALGGRALGQEIPKLNLGVVLPLSGPQAAFGEEALRGIELALEEFRKREPDVAQHVTLIKGDDKSQAQVAGEVATEMFKEKRVHVVIGSVSSTATSAIAAVAEAQGRPLVAPLATDPGLGANGHLFRISAADSIQGQLLGAFAGKELKSKRAAVIRDATPAAETLAARFEEAFQKAGGKVVATEVYDFGTSDFAPALVRIKNAKPDVILAPASYHTAAIILRQAEGIDLKARFLGGDSWDSPELAKGAGKAGIGHFHSAHFALDAENPRTAAFVEAFRARYGRTPGAVAALAYDSAGLVFDALVRARTVLPKPLLRAFQRTAGFEGVTGTVTYDEQGRLSKSVIIKETHASGSKFKTVVAPAG